MFHKNCYLHAIKSLLGTVFTQALANIRNLNEHYFIMRATFTFLLLFWPLLSIGQHKNSVGVLLGPNYSDIRGYPIAEEYDYYYGFSTALQFNRSLGQKIELNSSLSYDIKRTYYNWSKRPFDPNDPVLISGLLVMDYRYLSLCTNFRYYVFQSNNFFAQAGSYYAYLIRRYDKMGKEVFVSNVYTKAFDFGLCIGIGYQLTFGRNHIQVIVSDNIGLLADKINSYNLLIGWSIDM